MRQPRLRKANIVCIHLYVDISYKVKDKYAAVHRPRVGNKDAQRGNAWISLERGDRREFMSRLDAVGDGNLRDQGRVGQSRTVMRKDQMEDFTESGRSLMQG